MNASGGWIIVSHEQRVENFYSSGLNRGSDANLNKCDQGFLSFGYWEKDTKSYVEAANNLLEFFIINSEIKDAGKVLNVSCGYGTETIAFYRKFRPKTIEGIDITKVHVDCANERAKQLGLEKNVIFRHGDACNLDAYQNESVSHILGIEGPANFRTRERFFMSAGRVLKSKGELILNDIILGERCRKIKKFHMPFFNMAIRQWVIPKENIVDEKRYVEQLKNAGFGKILIKRIGGKVFPGYSRNSLSLSAMRSRTLHRGLMTALGLAVISYILGYLYRKGIIEYIFVRAQKD